MSIAQDSEPGRAVNHGARSDMSRLELMYTQGCGDADPRHVEGKKRCEQATVIEFTWEAILSSALAHVGAVVTVAIVEAAGLDADISADLCIQMHACRCVPP